MLLIFGPKRRENIISKITLNWLWIIDRKCYKLSISWYLSMALIQWFTPIKRTSLCTHQISEAKKVNKKSAMFFNISFDILRDNNILTTFHNKLLKQLNYNRKLNISFIINKFNKSKNKKWHPIFNWINFIFIMSISLQIDHNHANIIIYYLKITNV